MMQYVAILTLFIPLPARSLVADVERFFDFGIHLYATSRFSKGFADA